MNFSLAKKKEFDNSVIMVDGLPGCGKTLFSQIISSFSRVEILNYCFEIEFMLRMYKFKKISEDATHAMCKMLIDHKTYQTMMGRDTNFRYSDLSSVFNNPFPLRYFQRIFGKGDNYTTDKIALDKPIMNFAIHDILSYSEPLFNSLGQRLYFIEIVRHPVYMIKQQKINMENLLDNPRDIQIKYHYENNEIPYFAEGWENIFLKSNSIDKAIYTIYYSLKKNENFLRNFNIEKYNYLQIPFEKFVLDPNNYIKKICEFLKTNISGKTKKVLKKQKIPRKKIEDGIAHRAYIEKGWEPSNKCFSEEQEIKNRIKYAKESGASNDALGLLQSISDEYLKNHKWF